MFKKHHSVDGTGVMYLDKHTQRKENIISTFRVPAHLEASRRAVGPTLTINLFKKLIKYSHKMCKLLSI